MAIQSFRGKLTAAVADGSIRKGFPADLIRRAQLLLNALQMAERLDDLRLPPGNQLEALKGDRKGQHSVRVNGQFRICFRWTEAGPADVEIIDYH